MIPVETWVMLVIHRNISKVLRQASFIEKMNVLGWTSPGFFDEPSDELVLEHALARYHA